MSEVEARCLICGKLYKVAEDHKDYQKINTQKNSSFICDLCGNKVRFESDENRKQKKPLPPSS